MFGHQGRRASANIRADGGGAPGQSGACHTVAHLLVGEIDAPARRILGEDIVDHQRQRPRDGATH
ncbi:hypothetical protein D3C76_1611220 [compost metagenome]